MSGHLVDSDHLHLIATWRKLNFWRQREKRSPGRATYSCTHDTIQTILTSGQKQNVMSLMSFFVLGSVRRVRGSISWRETCLVSIEGADANALHYCSFMLHLHHIIAIIPDLLSKVTI